MKTCTKCDQEKEETEFCFNKRAADGKDWMCKSCQYAYGKEYRKQNKVHEVGGNRTPWSKEELKKLKLLVGKGVSAKKISQSIGRTVGSVYLKIYQSGLRIKRKDAPYKWKCVALGQARARAKKYKLAFNLCSDDLPEPTHCAVSGLELDYKKRPGLGQKGRHEASAELDRIIPALGYVKGNVNVLSSSANRIKSNLSIEFIESLLIYMKSHKKIR